MDALNAALARKLDEARADINRLQGDLSALRNQLDNARREYDDLLAAVQEAIADDRARLAALLAAIRRK